MGKSRADIVMVLPDAVAGIEIKSDADTYVRLQRQVRDYNRYYDTNLVVVGSTHARHIKDHVPAWWGILTAEKLGGTVDFYTLREPGPNPKVDIKRKLGLLWRPELAHIQELNQMPKYREKSKAFVIDKILLKVPQEILTLQISEELFQRDYTTIEEKITEYRKQKKHNL